jgi:hypothetical protein
VDLMSSAWSPDEVAVAGSENSSADSLPVQESQTSEEAHEEVQEQLGLEQAHDRNAVNLMMVLLALSFPALWAGWVPGRSPKT